MKPVLYWGVVRGSLMHRNEYTVIRVSRDAGHQISGVRVGDIGAVTLRSSELVGKFKTQEQAEAAIQAVGNLRKPYDAEITRLEQLARAERQKRDAHEKKTFHEMPGSLYRKSEEGDHTDPDAGGF